jgi:ferredoxin
MQDIILRIKKRFRRKSRFRFSAPVNWLRYPFLALAVISFLAGTIFLVNLLDPFSNFGRIVSDFFRPLYILTNNTGAKLLEKVNVFLLYPEDITLSRLAVYVFPSLLLGVVIWMSLKWGRLYCNTICPVGTLLGLFSRVSIFKIKIIGQSCTRCGKCASDCKANCIDINEQKIDFSRCVGCFNCLRACPEDAVRYLALSFQRAPSSAVDNSRRKMIAASGIMLAGILGLWKFAAAGSLNSRTAASNLFRRINQASLGDTLKKPGSALPRPAPHNKIPTKIEPDKHFTVTPPGSLGIGHFTKTCTACHLCISACPSQVLQPSVFEYGLTGIMQPFMDYETDYCTFECIICSEVCPTGAILSLTLEAKKTLQIGKVNLILDNCVVKTDNTACGSCSEHCPTQAVRMVQYIGELTIPEIRPELCVGCGACEHACPTRPFRAIYVDGNYIHQTALVNKEEKLEETVIEEFPF